MGDPGEEDEGHLPHPQLVQLRRDQQVPDRRGVVPRKRPSCPAEGAGGRLGESEVPLLQWTNRISYANDVALILECITQSDEPTDDFRFFVFFREKVVQRFLRSSIAFPATTLHPRSYGPTSSPLAFRTS